MAKANAKKKPEQDSEQVQTLDIPHEEVPGDASNNSLVPTVITPEEQLKQEITKFNLADTAIAALKQQYGALTIAGTDDKKGYETVRKAWGEVRSKRTGLEKKGLELRNGYTIITKGIKKEEDRLIELITPLEDDLYKKWKAIDDEKEQEKNRIAQEAEKKLQARVAELMTAGMTLSDGFYQIGGTISMDVATLRGLPDEQYTKLLGAVQQKKAELDQIEKERLEREKKQRDEFESNKRQLEEQQRQFREQQQEFERQQRQLEQQQRQIAEEKQKIRDGRLIALGMSLRPDGTWIYDNGFNSVSYSAATLNALDAYGFDEHVKILAENIKTAADQWEQHKEELRQEQDRIDKLKIFVSEALEAIGFSYKYKADLFTWSNDFDNITVKMEDMLKLDGPEIVNKATEFGRRIMDAEKKQEDADRQLQEKQEQERIASQSDAVNWAEYLAILQETPVPEFKSEAYQKRADVFGKKFLSLLEEASDERTE